jgi:transcriptional regulator with XRE-family HTH domain
MGKLIIGEKIRRIRMFKGVKQEFLASKLGVSQSQVSIIETQDKIEQELLFQIAEILNVTPKMIEDFDDEKAIYNINNFYDIHDNAINDNASQNFVAQIFHPVEKINELYERLLQSEREKVELLKAIVEKHK